MHALGEHVHGQIAAGQTAQRGGAPQLFVIAAARIQTHHQRGLADAVGQMVHIERQVIAAGLFAAFNQNDAARMRRTLRLQGHQRGQ